MSLSSAEPDAISHLLFAAQRLRLVRRTARRFFVLGTLERQSSAMHAMHHELSEHQSILSSQSRLAFLDDQQDQS